MTAAAARGSRAIAGDTSAGAGADASPGSTSPLSATADAPRLEEPWASVPARLRAKGLRWTPQRRLLLEVLSQIEGHITGAELVEQCRTIDPGTTPSTVYRTLDMLEEIGLVRHGHGPDGREEYHVRPAMEHGHLYCSECGGAQEIPEEELSLIGDMLRSRHGFAVDGSHITVVGRCASCRPA